MVEYVLFTKDFYKFIIECSYIQKEYIEKQVTVLLY